MFSKTVREMYRAPRGTCLTLHPVTGGCRGGGRRTREEEEERGREGWREGEQKRGEGGGRREQAGETEGRWGEGWDVGAHWCQYLAHLLSTRRGFLWDARVPYQPKVLTIEPSEQTTSLKTPGVPAVGWGGMGGGGGSRMVPRCGRPNYPRTCRSPAAVSICAESRWYIVPSLPPSCCDLCERRRAFSNGRRSTCRNCRRMPLHSALRMPPETRSFKL